MKQTIILSGKSGSGKDVVAQFMREALEKRNKRVLVLHYADALKWFLRDYMNWDGQKDAVGRTLLQQVGTDIVRSCHPNFWTDIVVGLIQAFEPYNNFDVAIVPDARFPNEIDIALRTLKNCVSVRIIRKNEDGTDWINPTLTEDQLKHPSETSLDCYGFDYILHNEKDLDELREGAEAILKDLYLI